MAHASKGVTAKRMKEQKALFLELFKDKAGNITQCCKALGVSRVTYYRWCDEDYLFKEDILAVREGLVDFAENTLLTLIKGGHPGATIFFLKTQGKHRGYSE